MRLLGDRTSGGHRGARGFGSDLMNCRSGLLLPGTGSYCPYLGGSSPRDSAGRNARGHVVETPPRIVSASTDILPSRIYSTVPNERLDSDFLKAARWVDSSRARNFAKCGAELGVSIVQQISTAVQKAVASLCHVPSHLLHPFTLRGHR